jgi:hypothetical protein
MRFANLRCIATGPGVRVAALEKSSYACRIAIWWTAFSVAGSEWLDD